MSEYLRRSGRQRRLPERFRFSEIGDDKQSSLAPENTPAVRREATPPPLPDTARVVEEATPLAPHRPPESTPPPPPLRLIRRTIVLRTVVADVESSESSPPEEDPLGNLQKYLTRTGGFPIVTDYSSGDGELSYNPSGSCQLSHKDE